jgi:hypothetical protein
MRVWELQRIGAVLKGWSKPSVSACLCLALSLVGGTATAQPTSTVVSPTEQSTRDGERLRILRDELRKSEALVESLSKRKAERLAVSDTVAADEAEEGRIRALSDIAGIKREIVATRPSGPSGDAPKALPNASGSSASPKSAQPKPQPAAPWWDVYGKARRGDTPASVSYAQPPGPAAAPIDSTRRME